MALLPMYDKHTLTIRPTCDGKTWETLPPMCDVKSLATTRPTYDEVIGVDDATLHVPRTRSWRSCILQMISYVD